MDNSYGRSDDVLTTEVFDFIKLSSLLDFSKLPLLSLLESEGEPLRNLLERKQNIIKRLVRTGKIYQDELSILRQIQADTGPTDLEKLDVRLLCVLARNISNVQRPKRGWKKKKLTAEDTSEGADVQRIGNIRNDCHHLPSSGKITREKFDEIYPELHKTLERLVKGTQNEKCFRNLVRSLEDPKFARRQCFLRTMKERAISKWRLNTERENSVEAQDQDVQQSEDVDDDSVKFREAIFANDVSTVEKMVCSQTPAILDEGIRIACLRGYNQLFSLLTDNCSSISMSHDLLAKACRGGSKEIVGTILERLDLLHPKSLENHTKDKRCCIHHAVSLGYQDIVVCLLEKIPRVLMVLDKDGNTAMHLASMRGQADVMETIYETKVGKTQVEAVNGKGLTPLHCSAYFGQLSAVQFLIQKEANKKAQDKYGQSIATWCEKGRDQNLLLAWYDKEFHLSPAIYGSQEDYENILEFIND